MITTIHIVETQLDDLPFAVPTFMFFSTDVARDRVLLDLFTPVCNAAKAESGVTYRWSLPDPAIVWGTVSLTADEASEFQSHNRRSGGIRMLLLDGAENAEPATIQFEGFAVDWLGDSSDESAGTITGGHLQLAKKLREANDIQGALDAHFAAIDTEFDVMPQYAAYALHEAAVIACDAGFEDAWNYFETVALMVYPNCHDALIGLAMTVQQDVMKTVPLLARAYAIRSDDADLRVLATSFGRAAQRNPVKVRDAVLHTAKGVDLKKPVFEDNLGNPLTAMKIEVLRHLRALQKRIQGLS